MNKMATIMIIIISKPNQKQRLVNKNQFSTQWLGTTFFLQSLSYSSSSSSSSTLPPPSHLHISRLILDQKSASQALRTFRWAADLPSFTHDLSTYRALIHKLCVFRRFDTARQLLDEMPHSIGCPPDDSIFVTIIRGLGRARMTRQAVQVLDLVARFGAKPSLKVLNSVLDVLVKDNIDLAREFYRNEMMGSGVGGDDYTHGILMKGLCLTNRIGEGFKLLQTIKSRGVAPNAVIYNTLIHALCRDGKVERARSLMSEMAEPNAVTFNILISGYCGEEDFVQPLVLLDDCLNLGLIPDLVTVTKVLEVLCNADRVSEAVEVLERVEGVGVAVDAVAYNTLIKGFCRTGKPRLGLGLMKKMEMKGCLSNVETYNLLISGFCDIGMLNSALDLFHDMKTDGVKWNFATYNLLIRGLCSAGRTQDGLKILEIMDENRRGTECHIGPYNSVIYGLYKEDRLNEALDLLYKIGGLFPKNADRSFRIVGFCKEGKIEDAKMVYDQMIKEGGNPSAIVYAHLIHGFCQKGCVREAFEVMNEMVGCGYLPVASTFNVLISGFCQQGMVGNASKLLEDMIERGCFPDTTETYSPLVDALCRKGNFQEALTLFLQMVEKGISPDLFIWNSLLLGLSREVAWLDVNHNLYVNRSLQRVIAST